MEDANNLTIAIGIGIGIVLVFGIYKLATRHLNASSTLRPGTRSSNGQQVLKAILAILGTIALVVALFFAWEYFI